VCIIGLYQSSGRRVGSICLPFVRGGKVG